MSRYRNQHRAWRQSGLSYVEVIVAVLIMSVAVVPAADALRSAMQSAEIDAEETTNHFQLVAKLESVLAEPFGAVAAQAGDPASPTTFSDLAGITNRRLVFISLYDGDNADADNDTFTGTDPDLLWIRVEIENTVTKMDALKGGQ